ncbi:hypothetical protein [Pseudorhodobacter sp.]|uniref:hypothetical protein n=1 Tax=Pseudorhodobacter sp. TaxID=1934400 RepID=UPI002AFF7C07|nr:hypothetical protein [Pseudorhodobacter sp.]
MTIYQQALAKRAPELNALHMETLAFAIGSTLNGMPKEFSLTRSPRWRARWGPSGSRNFTRARPATDVFSLRQDKGAERAAHLCDHGLRL